MAERTSAGPIMQVVRSEVQKLLRGWRRQVGDRAEAGHRRIPRCAIDALESRQLLSTLYIDGPTSASDTTITITQTEGTPETGPVFEVNGAASIAIDQNPSFIPQGIWTTPVSLYADGRIEVRMYGGNDTVTCSGDITVTTVVYGGAGNDSITTMGGNDSLYGEGGNDSLVGDGGSDLLDGGEGNDELHAGGGNDILLGGAGDDRLTGALGDNQLEGGAGDDLYVFVQIGIPAENDTIVEAAGASGGGDTLSFETMDAAIAVNLKGVASPGGGFWVATVPQRSILVQAQADAGNLENVIASTCGEAETNFIVGNAGTTSVSGGDGRDYVDCLASNLGVAFIGGAGDDSITTGSGNDTLWGGTGNDTLNGDGGNDSVVGEEGDDVLRGSGGSDTLWGGTGNDSLIGTLGNDSITGDEGNDTVLAGGGDDALDGGTGNDLLDGGGGYDLYTFGSYYVANEADTVNEAVGDTGGVDTLLLVGQVNVDLATAYADRKIAWGPSGTRTIYRSASTAVGEIENIIAGTCGPTEINTLTGGIRTMKVTGGDGRDSIDCSASTRGVTVLGGAGNDTITGSAHDDLLSGGDGDDWISGGTGGDDTLVGDYGYDTLVGGVGSDVYRFANGPGSSEQDRVEEEASNVGTDVLDFSPATEGVAVDLSQATPVVTMAYRTFVFSGRVENITGSKTGTNSLTAGPGATMVIGGEANDTISCANAGRAVFVAGYGGNDTITGSSYDDRLDGGDGNDSITGGAGNDLLLGGGGDDRLMGDDMAGGDSGADVLIGGSGADYLNGGNGADTPLAGSGNGTDTLDGGLGADTLNGQNGNDAVISGGDPNDSIVSSAGADLQPDLDVPVPTGGASGVATDRKAVIDRSGQTTGDAITVTRPHTTI